MSEYKASNGAKVFKLEDDSISVYGNPGGSPSHGNNLWPGNDVALAEYFQAERDKALGLWRWPENPDYVVKPSSRYSLAIIHEPTFWSRNVVHFADTRDVAEFMNEEPGKHLKPWRKAARAYLKEHPIKQPWHDARDGEAWLITNQEGETVVTLCVDIDGQKTFNRFNSDLGEIWETEITAPTITTAKRIWPEEGDNDA